MSKPRLILIGILISIVLFLLVALNGLARNSKVVNETNKHLTAEDQLQTKDFVIGGLYLKQPIAEVTKIFGGPEKIKKRVINDVVIQNYFYSGLVIGVTEYDQKVDLVRISNKNMKTYRGIGVGDSEKEVYRLYGKTTKTDNLLMYWMLVSQEPLDIYYAIGFLIKDGKVTRIDLDYAPSE